MANCTDDERALLDRLNACVSEIDNMRVFAGYNVKAGVKCCTLDGRYYRIRIEAITQAEFNRRT